ncbi:Uma2 family endonuclease [Persicitalea sp.]|uniref:Uma2 family endonuclease n=1 Tax=Persicitalea sp. TaxID=3100273 RepID=UPI003593A557
MAAATTTVFSQEEYFEILEKSEVKLEYRAGEIYTMWGEPIEERDGQLVTAESGLPLFPPNNDIMAVSGAKPPHNIIAANLIGEFFDCLKRQGCYVYSSDQLVRIEACDRNAFPDLAIVCEEPKYTKTKQGLDALTNPYIVIEILSKSTESYDRGEKYECYQTLESLKEYVLVSTKKRKIEVFARNTPHEWTLRIYDEENPLVKIGDCEIELADIYRMVSLETAS